jgi:hypothetical protein
VDAARSGEHGPESLAAVGPVHRFNILLYRGSIFATLITPRHACGGRFRSSSIPGETGKGIRRAAKGALESKAAASTEAAARPRDPSTPVYWCWASCFSL